MTQITNNKFKLTMLAKFILLTLTACIGNSVKKHISQAQAHAEILNYRVAVIEFKNAIQKAPEDSRNLTFDTDYGEVGAIINRMVVKSTKESGVSDPMTITYATNQAITTIVS